MTASLLARFQATLPDAEPAAADRVGQALLARWSEPHRRYHTLAHLVTMLDVIDAGAGLATDPTAVRLAAWYHDAVYDPTSPDNEARSAALAAEELATLGRDPTEVVRLVLLTAGHQVAEGDRDGALLCDADLAVLAAPEAEYQQYTRAVRAEYAMVPEPAFRAGRAAILTGLLALPALFRVHPHWEQPARVNLGAELRALSAGADPTA